MRSKREVSLAPTVIFRDGGRYRMIPAGFSVCGMVWVEGLLIVLAPIFFDL